MEFVLHSPAGNEPITFTWPADKHRQNVKSLDMIETMRLVCEDLPEIKQSLEQNILCDYDTENYHSMKKLCDRFNKTIGSVVGLAKGTSLPAKRFNPRPSNCLLQHILQQTYNEAVEEPEKLNQYPPFSPQVYGETSFKFISYMIERLNVTESDEFIDLGSGVGQVVLQMAAATSCRMCTGIEKAPLPNKYAENMDRIFRKWMNWYGKKIGPYQLIKGDFLMEEFKTKLNSATIIFVNNFAFGPSVDQKLKERFADLKDGTRIVSSKNFCPLNSRITGRNLTDIGTIMKISKMSPLKGSVSWTEKPVPYYLHVIDRSHLEKYFLKLKNKNNNENACKVNSIRRNINTVVEDNLKKENSVILRKKRKRQNISQRSRKKVIREDTIEEKPSVLGNVNESLETCSNLRARESVSSPVPESIHAKQTLPLSDSHYQSTLPNMYNEIAPAKKSLTLTAEEMELCEIGSAGASTIPEASNFCEVSSSNMSVVSESSLPTHITTDPTEQLSDEIKFDLEVLLDTYRQQFTQTLINMKKSNFRKEITLQIEQERKKQEQLVTRVRQISKQNDYLEEDNRRLLQKRLSEGDFEFKTIADLVRESRESVCKNKKFNRLKRQVTEEISKLEEEIKRKLIYRALANQARELQMQKQVNHETNNEQSRESIMKEISLNLAQRKTLREQAMRIENYAKDMGTK